MSPRPQILRAVGGTAPQSAPEASGQGEGAAVKRAKKNKAAADGEGLASDTSGNGEKPSKRAKKKKEDAAGKGAAVANGGKGEKPSKRAKKADAAAGEGAAAAKATTAQGANADGPADAEDLPSKKAKKAKAGKKRGKHPDKKTKTADN